MFTLEHPLYAKSQGYLSEKTLIPLELIGWWGRKHTQTRQGCLRPVGQVVRVLLPRNTQTFTPGPLCETPACILSVFLGKRYVQRGARTQDPETRSRMLSGLSQPGAPKHTFLIRWWQGPK